MIIKLSAEIKVIEEKSFRAEVFFTDRLAKQLLSADFAINFGNLASIKRKFFLTLLHFRYFFSNRS